MVLKRALLINGSPRRDGNNGLILDTVERGLKESDAILHRVEASLHKLHPCIYCRNCEKEKGCAIKDDMTWIYEELDRSDIIVVSSPLYFNGISAQLKALVDRCQAIWASKYVLRDSLIDREKERRGFFVCTAGQSAGKSTFAGAMAVMDIFFKATNVNKWEKLLITDVDNHPVRSRKELLEEVYQIAKKLADKCR